jgi:hypothetical protein
MRQQTCAKPSLLLLTILKLTCVIAYGQLTDTTRVAINDLGSYYEIENGYLGVRIPKSTLFNPATPAYVPAPVRCVVYRDGSLSADFPNYLSSPTPALTMTTTILYQTTDSCAIKVSYTFDKPILTYSNNTEAEPAGPGYYYATFRIVKGEKACMVTEESDYEVGYSLKASDGLSPDKGRYIGHSSTSVANGYDINGNQYSRDDRNGWHATVDLQYLNRKEYDFLARWNPWVTNTGWHWQLYNSTAGGTANTFGIFDGRPSLLLGVRSSGAKLYTEPSAISDLHAACDPDGNCHYVWQTEEEIWYKKIEANGTIGNEEVAATGFIRPYVFVEGNTVRILAIDPTAAPANQVKLLKKTGSGAFSTHTLTLDATLDDPFVYGASNGTNDFLIFKGTRSGQSGLLLYHATTGGTTYTYSSIRTNGVAHRAANRPDVKTAPDGRVVVAYAEGSSYQSYNVILPGTTTFATISQNPLGQTVTFGMAVDNRTGDFFWVDGNGKVRFVDLTGADTTATYSTNLNAPSNHQGFDLPNRRSFSRKANGDGLAYHEGVFYWWNNTTHVWSELSGSVWQNIFPVHIHYHPTDDLFYLVGKNQGRLVRYSYNGTGDPVLVNTFTSTERKTAGVKIVHTRLSPDGGYFPDIRFQWGIFAGKKNTDLQAADQVNNIGKTMNRLSGFGNKVGAYENSAATFSASFGNGGIYMTPAELQGVIQKIKTDDNFYDQMVDIDPGFKNVMDAWREVGTTITTSIYNSVVTFAAGLKDALKTGDGIYSYYHQYSEGNNTMRRFTTLASALMADTKLTTAQRDTLKKKVALFARITWDDDFVPFFEGHGLGLGGVNITTAFLGYRSFFAMLLVPDPAFSARAAAVPADWKTGLSVNLNAAGAATGSPHYLQPGMDGLLFTALQMKAQGVANEFVQNDTLRRFADFLQFLQTPPSVRFANNRKLICFGDGTEESAAIFGLLGTGFASVDASLSERLMYAYRHGPPRGSDYGFVTIAINYDLPEAVESTIGPGHFPGYLSTFRSGLGTANESASWFINGDWYEDHRNDDRGAVGIYALKAPLSLNYGSQFNPYAPSAHMKSTITTENRFPQWNQANQPFLLNDDTDQWDISDHQVYLSFKNSGFSSATFTGNNLDWRREVFQFSPKVSTPIFIIRDTMEDLNTNYIWNFNFAARDNVLTPNGTVDPPAAIWNFQGGPFQQPSASAVIPMAAGLNRFDFTGVPWIAHPSGGIDWEVYMHSPLAQQATLSEWAHTFIPTVESDEFYFTNNMANFEERQIMMRVKGQKQFYAVIIPYNKGQRPTGLSVTRTVDTLTVSTSTFTFKTNLHGYTYTETGRTLLTTFDNLPLTFNTASIEDGPAELEIKNDTIFARLHGQTGPRKIKLPAGNWGLRFLTPNATFDSGTGKWTLNHTMQADSVHNTYEGGYTEYIFVKVIKVAPKIFLQGPYNAGTQLMGDQLRSANLLPTEEPFTGLGFTHYGSGGGETCAPSVFTATGNNAIVDWVFLELRDKNNPATILASRSALLQKDGDVVDVDGVSPVDFHGRAVDNYYLAVKHRNHLACRTANTVALSGAAATVDFSTNLALAYKPVGHPNEALATLGGGKYGLWGGNANGDTFVKMTGAFPTNNDYLKLLNVLGGSGNTQVGVYSPQDVNMDSNVKMTGAFPSNNDYLRMLNVLGGSGNIIIQAL